MKRKLLAGFLSLCMVVSLFPTAAFAEGETQPEETTPVEETVVDETPAEETDVQGIMSLAETTKTGTLTPVYTRADGFWGEGTSNSTESFVVELYEGSAVIAKATLNNLNGIIDGDVYVTWSIPFAGSTTGGYWDVEWAEGYPKYDMNPTVCKLVVDGSTVAESAVQYNAPDNLNKIVALAEGFTGGVKAYTSIADACGNFNGRKVNVLRDVTENIEEFNGVTLTTNVADGVTVTTTYDDWAYANDFNIGKGVTVKAGYLFYETDGVNTVEGTLETVETLYNGYNAKTTVKNGGNIKVGDSTILRYNEDGDAGLYIYGDGDDSTVEFDCNYYIGAYSGTFYAEDATIETGYFLLKNSYDNSEYADIDMKLNNSKLTVVGTNDGQDSFIIDDQASLTLENGSEIKDVREFNILAGTNLTFAADATSSIEATNVSIADGVPFGYEKNNDGTVELKPVVAKIGSTDYTDLHEAMTAAKSGETVELVNDVDLSGTEWEPVSFKGNFDGKNHTIKNLTINKPGVSNTGFITSLNGTFENVTFTNPTVTGGENTGVVAGRAGGGAALAKNITVNGTIKVETTHSGYARTGAIVGGWAYGRYIDITVDGGDKAVSYIRHTGGGDGRYVAGIVGHADDVDEYTNCVVKNITIDGKWLCGGIAGPGPSDSTVSGCVVEDVDIASNYSGGMFGWYYGDSTIKDSTVKDVTFTESSTNNGPIGGYGENSGAVLDNVKVENVKNIDGKPLLNYMAEVNGTEYLTFAEAVAAANSGDTITLLKDTTAGKIEVDKDVKINLNGKTLNGNILAKEGTEVEIENGKIVNEDSGESAVRTIGNKLTLTNVDIKSARHAVRVESNNAEVTINGGVYETANTDGKTVHAVNVSGDGAKVVINDGTFKGPKGTAADSGAAVNVQAGSKVVINGGNFSGGKNNTLASKGTLEINGGTFDQNPETYVVSGHHTVQVNGQYEVHEIVKVAEKAAECTKDGVKAHYKCEECNEIYLDKDGLNVVAAEKLVISATGHKFASCSYDEVKHYYKCACGETYYKDVHKDADHDSICEGCGYVIITPEAMAQIMANRPNPNTSVTADMLK